MQRNLTEEEEQIYRLVSPEFEGLSHKAAAAQLGITRQGLEHHLRQIKKKAPSLFPILTQQQYQVYQLFQEEFGRVTIARAMECTPKQIDNIQAQLLKKGFDCRIHRNGRKTIFYDPSMDNTVVRKF